MQFVPSQSSSPRFRGHITLAVLALSVAFSSSALAACPEPLLATEGFPHSRAFGINSLGQTTGTLGEHGLYSTSSAAAVVWDSNGRVLRVLDPLPGHPNANGIGINSNGVVAGSGGDVEGPFNRPLPVVWDKEGKGKELQLLPGHEIGLATAINDVGQVVGESRGSGGDVAVIWEKIWKRTSTPRALTLPEGTGPVSSAKDINNRGEIVGYAEAFDATIAVKWDANGSPQTLPPLPGFSASTAHGISRFGVVVGTSSGDSEDRSRATKWTRTGTIRELPPLPGDDSSLAYDINRFGVILGSSSREDDGSRVSTLVTWDREGNPTPHHKLRTFDRGYAVGINDKGEFVGHHSRSDGEFGDQLTSIGTLWVPCIGEG